MSYQTSNIKAWVDIIERNAPPAVIRRLRTKEEYGEAWDTFVLILQVTLILIGLGVAIPVALWVGKRVVRSGRRLRTEIEKKK